MAKISELTDAGLVSAADHLVALRAGGNVQVNVGDMAAQSSDSVSITGGSIDVTSLTVTSALTVDTDTLVVDATNNRVGIGTSSPWETASIPFDSKLSLGSSDYPLSISRSSSGALVTTIEDGYDVSNTRLDFKMRAGSASEVIPLSLSSSGRVGIGTSSPTQAKLDILLESDYSSHTGHGLSVLSNAQNAYTALYMGSDDTIDAAYIQTAGRNTSFTSKSLLLNPNGGQVGVGSSSPAATLHLDSTGVTAIAFDSDISTQQYEMGVGYGGVGSNNFYLYNNTTSSAAFIIDAANNLLVGTASDTAKLCVYEATNNTESDPHIRITGAGYSGYHWLDATAYYIGQNSGGRNLRLYSGASSAGVNLANNGTSWGTFSDERLKYDIEPIENALESLSNLRTVKYRLTDVDAPDSQKKLGLIAQDLVGVLDEVLDPLKRTGDETEYMSVRYTEIVPVLIKAIQEQQATIEALTQRIETLENN